MGRITPRILDKIDLVYERVRKQKITFNPDSKKKQLSKSTVNTYRDVVKAYNNYLEKTHGISIDKAKPRHAYEYIEKQIESHKEGGASAFTLRRFAHALESFRLSSKETGVFKHECRVGDKRVILNQLTENKVFRKAVDSKSLKANTRDYEQVHKELESNKSSMREYTRMIHELQKEVGCRIHEAVKMKVQDIDFEARQITIKGKGGLVRVVRVSNEETMAKLESLCADKGKNSQILIHRNKKGEQISNKELQKRVEKQIRDAAEKAGVDRGDKRYTTHSARKVFAQERIDKYAQLSRTQLKKEIDRRCASDYKLAKMKERSLNNIRNKITDPYKSSQRQFTDKEMSMWLTSVDLGHGRLDVLRFYCSYKNPTK